MTRRPLRIVLISLLLLSPWLLMAATPIETVVADAQTRYQDGSFADALALVTQAMGENPDGNAKGALSSLLSDIGLAEYSIKNYKNAWECFKLALKLKPTNQTATSYFLKMKKELDTANLKNEAPPRAARTPLPQAPAQAAGGTEVSVPGTQPGTVAAAPTGTTVQPAAGSGVPAAAAADPGAADREKSTAELKAMLAQLQSAQDNLAAAQSTVQASKSESEALKEQLKSQSALVEKMILAQTQAPRTAAAPAQSSQDSKVVQQTLQLLAAMEKRQSEAAAAAPQVVYQQDPAVDEMLRNLDAKITASAGSGSDLTLLYVFLAILSVILVGVVIFILMAISRSRQRVTREATSKEGMQYSATGIPRGPGLAAPMERSVPLLEFVGGTGTSLVTSNRQELDLRKSLLKADRLQKMYDDIRTGNLNWETVRLYIDELDSALKADILKIVENKLNTGDLVSHEAVLPIIFPFLSDYDDFLRHKAEKLAKVALVDKNESMNSDGSVDPFAVRELMNIPNLLVKVLKGHDRSLVTANLSRAIAKHLGLSSEECQQVYKGALAHDVGYLMLDQDELSRILGKAEISDEEFGLIQSHAVKGMQYFGEIELPRFMHDAMLCHHERKDGSGYPNGLKGNEIPLIAQIIGVAETFSALLKGRAHRDKLEASHALAILKDGARTKFEKPVVDALVAVVSQDGGF